MNQIDGTEHVLIGNWHARLPSAICTDPAIFNSIFSIDTWENVLRPEAKQRILQLLPKEILSCQGLAVQTIHDLLSGDLSRFSSTPLETFFNQLDGGLFEPSVVPTREAIKKVWRKDSKRIIKKCQIKVLQELLVSTTKYLDNFPSKEIQTNGIGLHSSLAPKSSKDSVTSVNGNVPARVTTILNIPGIENELQQRARKRFLSELSEINMQGNCASSDDEEFPVTKKPTRHTYRGEAKKQLIGKTLPKKQPPDHKVRPAGTGSQVLGQQQLAETLGSGPSTGKPVSRPTTLKSREEQTAAQMAKFPKILPAPSVVSPSETKPAIGSEETGIKIPTASTSSQFKNSPLLASQLQAPIISSKKHGGQSEMQLANRVLQMQSNAGSSFSHSPFGMSIVDEMSSSSDDEFESIEPTIGFASNANLSASRNFSPKTGTKGSKALGRNLQNSKTKGKASSSKQSISSTKLTTTVVSVQSSKSTSTSSAMSTASADSVRTSSQASSTSQTPMLFGFNQSPASSSAPVVKLEAPPILLTSGGSTGTNLATAIQSTSLSTSSGVQSLSTPTIKLTPGMINTLGANRLLSALTPGVALLPDGQVGNLTARPTQSVTSFNISNTTIAPGTSNVFVLNGPLKSNSEVTQNETTKSQPVFRIQCGPSSQTFTASTSNTTPVTSKQYLQSRISSMVSPITLQDLNFSLNADGNVVQTNSSEQKLLSDSAEDKIDDLSVLDGNPFDSIPNLSDELDGFDLDLVEVCDFHSLLSEEKHYASFFSLIRDVLCSTKDHRMTFVCLEKTIRKWSLSPSAPSNSWFTLVNDWNEALSTALNFLAGNYQDAHPEDFVPYIEYKYKTKYYQWIGAGRDSDNNMLPLCSMWLENLGRLPPIKKLDAEPDEPEEDDEDNEDSDSPDVEVKKKPKRPITPPPPRCVTTWTVRPSNDEEREYFQEQERQRFENPHKAFTYRMHDYESVVGPVKGVYSSQSGVTNKARGHSLLIDDRPPYVTILALVRDAVARLPNGEGTRSEICEMLRDSAFLAPEASNITLNSVVSGALDRLHYERDPCVRYDSHKKSWIYLHRDRNQEQFERLHHNRSYTKSTKSRSNTSRKVRKHNKSTSSSGSQGHGQIATPSSSPTTSDQSSSATTSTVSTVKLPPIETMLGKSGNITLAQASRGQQIQSDSAPKSAVSNPLPQNQNGSLGVTAPQPATSATTLLAAQLSKPIANTSSTLFHSTIPSSVKSTTPAMAMVPTVVPQANSVGGATGQLMLGSNVVRFGGPLRFSQVRVPGSAATAGLRLSPRIVLRGGVAGQNQGIIVGQTPDGQTIIFQAAPSSGVGVGTMQVQLSSPAAQAQPEATTQSFVVTSNVSASMMNASSNMNSTLSPATSSALPSVAILQNSNKPVKDTNVVVKVEASNAPPSSNVSNMVNVNAAERPQQHVVSMSSQIPKQLTALANAGVGSQTSPIIIKSNQGNFIVPARIYGTGPVGEFKMVPIPGAGNQTVYARIVPQSSDLSSAPTPSVRFITPEPPSSQ